MANNELDLRLRIRVNNDGTAQVLNGVQHQISQVGQQANTATTALHSMGTAGSAMGSSVASGAHAASNGLTGMTSAASIAANSIKTMVAAYISLEAAQKIVTDVGSFQDMQTRLESLTRTNHDYAQSFAYISQVAADQHKELLTLSDGYAKLRVLQNSGVISAGQLKGLFEGINNAASDLGGTGQLKEIFYGLAQGLSAGTLHAEELNQVMEPLPGLMQSIDKAAGLQAGGFRKLVNDGKITSDMFANVLVKALHDYDGAAAASANNINAKLTDIKNSWTLLIGVISDPINDALTPFLNATKIGLDQTRLSIAGIREENEKNKQTTLEGATAVMTVQGVNISAANTIAGAWSVVSMTLHDVYTTLGLDGVAAALEIAAGWVNSTDDMLSNTKTVANIIIGVFVGVGHAVGTVFAVMATNVQNAFANATAYARAAALDLANAAQMDFSFAATQSVKPAPLINGAPDVFKGFITDLKTDHVENFAAAVQGAAKAQQLLSNETHKTGAAIAQTTPKLNAQNLSMLSGADAADKHAKASGGAASAAKQLQNAVADELKSLDDQHAKLTLSESDYYAQTDVVRSMTAAQRALALAKFDQVKVDEASKAAADAQKNELESLTQKYNALTMSARDAYIAQLKAKGIRSSDIKIDVAKFDDITALEKTKTDTDAARQSLESYASSIDNAKSSMSDFGSIASSSLDGSLGGVSAMAGAFGNLISNLNDSAVAMSALRTKQQELVNFKPANKLTDPQQYAKDIKMQSELSKKFAAEQTALTNKATQAQLAGFGQIAGAAKGMFDEQSGGYKALQAAEQTFRAFEMAQAIMSFDTQGGLMQAFTQLFTAGKQAEQTADATATTQAVAQSQIRGQAKATEAVTTQASAGPYIGFALMAAMAVAMAALGFNTGSAGSVSLSESRQEKQGTGTVFGDAAAKSESIANAIETMKDVDLTMLPLTAQMAASLRSIESSLAGLGNLLIQANVSNPDVAGLGTTYNAYKYGGAIINAAIGGLFGGPIGAFLGNEFGNALTGVFKTIDPIGSWLGAEIFGKTTASVADSGITIPRQSIADLMKNGLFAQQYADIKKETEYVFGLISDSSMSRQLQTLSGQAADQINKLMQSIVFSVQAAAGYLTGSSDEIQQKLSAYVLDIGDISLKDLKGQELTDALNHVFSKAADDVATAAFNQLVPFQRVGEGYFETLIRVATGVEQARVSLQALNVPAIEYTNVINKQGDVYAEMVRQSLVAVESLDGAVNGVGQIITALDASGEDLLATYQSLVEVRNLMIASGINGSVLDASVIGGAGGLDPLKSALSTYQEQYFTEQERLTSSTREMIVAFAALNLAMPESRDGFRELVDGIDTSTAAGKVLLGQVLQLADGFDAVQSQYESVLSSLQDSVTNAYDNASQLLQNQIDTFRQYADSLREFSDSLITGNLSTATPAQQYQSAKNDFLSIKNVLANGTDKEKEAALGNLQTAAQAYLDASRGYNASGMQYVKDFADVQSVLATAITDSEAKADIATQQLTALTAQLTALGLIKTSVDDVTTAVNAVGIALAGLDAFKAAQDASKVKTANEAAFDKIESSRKQAYEAAIAEKAGVIGSSAARYEGMLGFSAGTSKNPFSAAGTIDVSTGAVTSDVTTTAGGPYAGDIASSLQADIFPRVAGSLKMVATKLQGMLGGVLPAVDLKFGDDQSYGPGFYEYTFADVSRRINSDQIALLERAFADDLTDYLADQLTNKDWIDPIKAVEFSSLGSGFTALATTLAKLKDPYQTAEYDPTIDYTTQLKTFAKGGVSNQPAIFGEAGPEAAVPLPDGRSIPVMLFTRPVSDAPSSAQRREDDGELLEQLKKSNDELKEQNKILVKQIEVMQAGFSRLLKEAEQQNGHLDDINARTRVAELSK